MHDSLISIIFMENFTHNSRNSSKSTALQIEHYSMLPLFIRVLYSTVCFSLVLVTIFASIPLFLGLHIMSIRESSWMDKRWKSVSIVDMCACENPVLCGGKQRYKCPKCRRTRTVLEKFTDKG